MERSNSVHISTPAAEIYGSLFNDGGGGSIVLLSDIWSPTSLFERVIQKHVSFGACMVTLDLPGVGRSAEVASTFSYSIPDQAETLFSVLSELRRSLWRPLTVITRGIGALAAIHCEALHRGSVNAVVLCGLGGISKELVSLLTPKSSGESEYLKSEFPELLMRSEREGIAPMQPAALYRTYDALREWRMAERTMLSSAQIFVLYGSDEEAEVRALQSINPAIRSHKAPTAKRCPLTEDAAYTCNYLQLLTYRE